MIDPSDMIAALAVIVGVAALVMAVRRDRNAPPRLANREDELLEQIGLLKRDIASLQRMLVEKQNQIDKLNERIRQLERITPEPAPANHERRRVLLVGVGDQAMLQEDLAQLRKVQAQTNIQINRLLPVSKASLERIIERRRASGNPVELLHLAVHAGPDGLQFSDGIASGLWLSERLAGVKIAVLAGCTSDSVADLIGVVPAVVSMREEVENRDASLFAGAFWMAVGGGMNAEEAFEWALQRAPATVGEFVELHL